METIALVTLKHQDKIFNFKLSFGYEYPMESALYMFEEGNYSCDCNKSLFIQRYCNPDFPEMNCGNEIELANIIIQLNQKTCN